MADSPQGLSRIRRESASAGWRSPLGSDTEDSRECRTASTVAVRHFLLSSAAVATGRTSMRQFGTCLWPFGTGSKLECACCFFECTRRRCSPSSAKHDSVRSGTTYDARPPWRSTSPFKAELQLPHEVEERFLPDGRPHVDWLKGQEGGGLQDGSSERGGRGGGRGTQDGEISSSTMSKLWPVQHAPRSEQATSCWAGAHRQRVFRVAASPVRRE